MIKNFIIMLPVVLILVILLSGITFAKNADEIDYPPQPPGYKKYDQSAINNEQKWSVMNVHDPSVYKDGDWYYVFSTDIKVGGTPEAGIQVRKSKDLIHWQWVGYALERVPEDAYQWTKAKGLWAPDVIKFGDYYYLYYAASQFGTNRSFIGVLRSRSIEGPWDNLGEVVKTKRGDIPNAIDPNLVIDRNGTPWLAFGSFFGGIYISKLDPATGKLVDNHSRTLIARRSSSVSGALEGPYIIYNSDYDKYYLFVSYDSLFSDYNVRVGRADNITGPYFDYNGHQMTDLETDPDLVGNMILAGYKFNNAEGWMAPGHNSILKTGNNYYIVHHAKGESDINWSYLHVRKILWTDDGWPLVSPERYAGENVQAIKSNLMSGSWEMIKFNPDLDVNLYKSATISLLEQVNNNLSQDSKELNNYNSQGQISDDKNNNGSSIVNKIGNNEIDNKDNGSKVSSDKVTGHFEKTGNNSFKIVVRKEIYRVKVIPAWDWENDQPALVFTGIDRNGIAVWGKKIR